MADDKAHDETEEIEVRQRPRRKTPGWAALLGSVSREQEAIEESRARLALAEELIPEIHQGNLVLRSAARHRESELQKRRRELKGVEKSVRQASRRAQFAVSPGPVALVRRRLGVAGLWVVVVAILLVFVAVLFSVGGWVLSWVFRFVEG